MKIAIPIFDGFTALDAVGPYEVLSRLPGAEVIFLGEEAKPYSTDTRMLTLIASATFEQLRRPEVLLVPGGPGTRALLGGGPLLQWLRTAHQTSTWTTSVCTGSLLLAAAGLLHGCEATGHWLERETLRELGAKPVAARVVRKGKLITAAGVSAGIDMGLQLAAQIAGEQTAKAIQLAIEYDPQPPFDCGSPERAPAELVDAVRALAAARTARRAAAEAGSYS
jgi:putative intracellular protease/amidase